MSCRTNPSPIRFCTGDHGLAEPNRNHRLAPHNSAKQTGAKANARRSPDQAAPRQTQGAPKAAHQGKLPPQLRQADRRQGTRKVLARPSSARAIAGHPPRQAPTGGNSRHNSASRQAPRHAQGARQTKQRQGTRRTPIRTSNAEVSSRRANTHQDKQRQTKRRQVYKPKSPASMETGDFSCRDPELLVAVL